MNKHACEVIELDFTSFLEQFSQEWLKDEIRFRTFLKLNEDLPIAPRCMVLRNHNNHERGYATLFEGDQILLSDMSSNLTAALTEHLMIEKLTVPGMFGPSKTVCDFSTSLSRLARVQYSAVKTLIHWKLSQPLVGQPNSQRIRLAQNCELAPLARFYSQMQEETNTQRHFNEQAVVEAKFALSSLYVITTSDDEPVSVAFVSSPSHGSNVSEIGGLYTPPAHRGKGYAFALVSHLSAQILQDKRTVFLSSDTQAVAANRLYERLGYSAKFQMTNMRLVQAN